MAFHRIHHFVGFYPTRHNLGPVSYTHLSIEKIDQHVLRPLLEGLSQYEDYRIMVLPDHPTPLSLRSHTSDPVPFLIYQKNGIQPQSGISCFDEESAKNTGVYLPKGYWLMECFLGKREIPMPFK